jgi:hypothetical protein
MSELDHLWIRQSTPHDEVALAQLAQLDDAPTLSRPGLVAERDGRVVAYVSLVDGRTMADPFLPTAELRTLLRLRAAQLRGDSASAAIRPERHRQPKGRAQTATIVGGAEFQRAESGGVR